MNAVEIGNRLRELRERSGLSAKEVSEILMEKYQIDMNHRTLFNYEKGRSSPDIDRFLTLCKIYSCRDVLYEFGYTDIKEIYNIHNSEEKEVVEKYRKLPESGKDLIRGALGIEKGEEQRMEGIS